MSPLTVVQTLAVLFLLPLLLRADTVVLLGTSSNPSIYGAPLRLTATLTPGNVTGKVTFYDGATVLGAATVQGGAASYSTAMLPAGIRKVSARYSGDMGNASALSNLVLQRVNAVAGTGFAGAIPLAQPVITSLEVADFNQDGHADLLSGDGTRLHVRLGNGDGSFRESAAPLGVGPAVGDFNRDGWLDIAVELGSGVVVWFGDGSGAFTAGPSMKFGSQEVMSFTGPLSAGDLDGDGTLDLFVPAASSYAFFNMALGNGDGTFRNSGEYFRETPVTLSLIADLDGDARADLALAGGGRDDITVVSGFAVGGFARGFRLGVPKAVTSLAAADVNSDGITDLVVAMGGMTSVFTQLANGSLQSAVGLPLLTGSIGLGDFDGDGNTDVVAGGASAFAVATGTAAGTFGAPALYPGAAPLLAVADFNGDGRADVALGNPGAGIEIHLAGSGLRVAVARGSTQSTPGGTAFAIPLEVSVTNNGVPVSGATVTYSADGGTSYVILSSAVTQTDAFGIASVTATAGNAPATYLVRATCLGRSVAFLLTNQAPVTGIVLSGSRQSAVAGTAFANSLQVTVLGVNGIPVPDVAVTFHAPSSGASAVLSGQQAFTDASGVASIQAAANGIPGSYEVAVSAAALAGAFQLSNLRTAAANLSPNGVASQSSTLFASAAYGAGKAIDGDFWSAATGGSLTKTELQENPWWDLDLLSPATISGVTIYPGCCGLTNFRLFVSNAPFSPGDTPDMLRQRAGVWSQYTAAFSAPFILLPVAAEGRYVRVQIQGSATLSLGEVRVTGSFSVPPSNLATGKAATQSSTHAGASADLAIDGDPNPEFKFGTITHTTLEANPWWQVDLGSSAAISSIVIYNRLDCCSERLSDYWVFVSDTPFTTTDTAASLQSRAGTFSSHQVSAPYPSIAIPVNARGRFVRVQLSGSGYLSLAEVKVIEAPASAGSNLSLGKPATQSSTLSGYSSAGALSAVDGNTDGNFFHSPVTHTNQESYPWWQVDLGASSLVDSIGIWNRTDACCVNRLADFWIFVSDAPFGSADSPSNLQSRAGTWAIHQQGAPNPFLAVAVNASGRYVRVQLAGTGTLSLAEVQVFGQPGATAPFNLAPGKVATQSSSLSGYAPAGAASAIDGNPDGNFFHNSVTHTNTEGNAWWQVDLGASAAITNIAIWNRTDCCSERLSDYWVFVSDRPFTATETPSTLQSSVWSAHYTVAPNPSASIPVNAQGRYVRVQLAGTGALSLAEVQVTGVWADNQQPAVSNLSAGKSAAQSSTLAGYPSAVAAAALDGSTDGNFFHNPVTHTNADANSWWQVDLGATASVTSIGIWNRTDCCSDRLGDYWIFVSDVPFGAGDTAASLQSRAATPANHQIAMPDPYASIALTNVQGRYVRVQLSGAGPLSLAEVQVMGRWVAR
jgi:hypothetical protein